MKNLVIKKDIEAIKKIFKASNFKHDPQYWLLYFASVINIRDITKNYFDGKYILIFPFCSAKLTVKKWPYYSVLISQLKAKYSGRYDILLAPGPKEIIESMLLNTQVILDKGKSLKINELICIMFCSLVPPKLDFVIWIS
jgi:hypothetical protein